MEDDTSHNYLLVSTHAMAGPSWRAVVQVERHQHHSNPDISSARFLATMVRSAGAGVSMTRNMPHVMIKTQCGNTSKKSIVL